MEETENNEDGEINMIVAENETERLIGINTESQFEFNDSCEDQIRYAGAAGVKEFSLFIEPKHSNSIPKKPLALKKELETLIEKHQSIEKCIHTRQGKLIIKTKCMESARQISRINTLLGVPVTAKVHKDNLTSKFLLRNITTDCSLEDVKLEIENNNLKVQSIRRFKKKGGTELTENVLVNIFGTSIPSEIKIFLSIEKPKRFIDSARQCCKCFRFTHATAKCKLTVALCQKCGLEHPGECKAATPKCVNCEKEHLATDSDCPTKKSELEFLKFKCENNLTYPEARRAITQNQSSKTYSKIIQSGQSQTQFEMKDIEKVIQNAVEKAVAKAVEENAKIYEEKLQEQKRVMDQCLAAQNQMYMKCYNELAKQMQSLTQSIQFLTGELSAPSPKRAKPYKQDIKKDNREIETPISTPISTQTQDFSLTFGEKVKSSNRKQSSSS